MTHEQFQSKGNVTFAPVSAADFEELADIRVAAMRESLERVGRFDPVKARQRLRNSFSPNHTRGIIFEEKKAGFYSVRPSTEGLSLDHLYLLPEFQRHGIGSVVINKIFEEADHLGVPVLTGALRESASNRFYQRHGFTKTSESDWDIYYIRKPVKIMHAS